MYLILLLTSHLIASSRKVSVKYVGHVVVYMILDLKVISTVYLGWKIIIRIF